MSFLSFLDQALRQLGTHPPCERTAEITRSALRMKALYAELDARASAGDRSAATGAGAATSDLPPLHRPRGVEGGTHPLHESDWLLSGAVEMRRRELARSQVDAQDSTLKAGLGAASGRQPAAPEVEVVKPECDYPDCACGPDGPVKACLGFWTNAQTHL